MKITKEQIQEKIQGMDKDKVKKNVKKAVVAVGTGVVAMMAAKAVIKTRNKCKEVENDNEFELLIECEEIEEPRDIIKEVNEMSDREYIDYLHKEEIIPDEVIDYINEIEKEKEELEYIVGNKEVC